MRTLKPSDLVSDLAEDLATRWVPDVVGDFDIAEAVRVRRITCADVRTVDVPRVGGGVRHAPVLTGSALGAMREAVEPVRLMSDDVLGPSVCGYRAGASGSVSYSEEYRRFRSFAEALSDGCTYVVTADVRSFFDSVSGTAMRDALRYRFDDDVVEQVLALMRDFSLLGLRGLPAGYGDARLLANMLLARVDEELPNPFTRWVDDYRLFASSRAEADRAIDVLAASLGRFGLALNRNKVNVMSAVEYRSRRHGVPLDSVYHPQDETSEMVLAGLRSVFLSAVAEGDRRRLRFALPRLARERDSIAVEYALTALRKGSVDAPRLVHYLSAFTRTAEVIQGIRGIAADSQTADWTLMRVAPILCRIELGGLVATALKARARATESSLLWGTLLRVLAIHGRTQDVRDLLDVATIPDSRAAIAAATDLGVQIPDRWAEENSATMLALSRYGSAPIPKAESLL